MKFKLEGNSHAHRRYLMQLLSLQFEQHKELPIDSIINNLTTKNQVSNEEDSFICIECRHPLFDASNIIEHEKVFLLVYF